MSKIKLYQKIAKSVKDSILKGRLKPGDKLPSLRELKKIHRVSIGTALQAYLQLEEESVIESRPQSGFYVKSLELTTQSVDACSPVVGPVDVQVSDSVSLIFKTTRDPKCISLGSSSLNPSFYPVSKLNLLARKMIREDPNHSSLYEYPPGLDELRKQIAKRSFYSGKEVSPDEIVVTSGTLEAVNLCLRAVAQPGDAILVQSPTYFGILQSIEYFKMKVIEIPSDPKDGIDLDILEKVLKHTNAKALVITANFNNPTGSLMPEANKKRLVSMMAKARVPIIEDDVFSELSFGEVQAKSLFSYDSTGNVLYCSSFSKTLSPGLRVGWAIPQKFQADVEKLKYMSSMATASFQQRLIARYLECGGYDRHLRKLRRQLKVNMHAFMRLIYESFPSGTKVVVPSGGFMMWVEMPKGIDGEDLQVKALKKGISLAPGTLFTAQGHFKNYMRISYGLQNSIHVRRAFKILGSMMKE